MPRQIDEEVVSMQFENAKFEKNVKESMNTLDKLKEKLKFDGATKGLDEIEKASKKIDFSNLEKGIDNISNKFTIKTYAMQQLVWNFTDSLIEMGKNLIKNSSIGQAANGWKKYEEQTVNVQTILSAVSTKINELTGELYNVADVYDVMDRIAWYSDETSYSADQMTRAIADFSSTGQDLYVSKNMIEGIANACALAGVNASKAESAFTGFSKAIGEGYVSQRVWTGFLKTSGITANEGFKQACLDAAVAVGTLEEAEEGLYITTEKALKEGAGGELVTLGDFSSQLTKEAWLTTEVMEQVFSEYTGELSRAYEMYSSGQVKTTTEAIEAIKKEYEAAGQEIPKWLKSFKAAQEAVTYTQVIESIQTASASAWQSIYETMFGNIDEQRELWTMINDEMYGLMVQPIWDLQEVVDEAFTSNWDKFRDEIESTGMSMDEFESGFVKWMQKQGIRIDELIEAEGSLQKVFTSGKVSVNWLIKYLEQLGDAIKPITEVTNKLEEFQKIYDGIWNGEFGNGTDRIKKLTEAGYDYAQMQGLINEMAEKGHKAGYKLTAEDIADLSEEQLKNIGYTEEQIAALKDLAKQAKDTGTPLGELMQKLTKPSGKELLKESLVNLIQIANNLKTILQNIFSTVFQNGAGIIYNLLYFINKLTGALVKLTDPEMVVAKLLNAIASAISLVYNSIIGLIKGAINTFNKVLELLGINLENVSKWIGIAFDWFSDFARSSNIPAFFEKIGNVVFVLAGSVKLLFDTIKNSSIVNTILKGFVSAFSRLKDIFKQITKGTGGFSSIIDNVNKLKNAINGSTITNINDIEDAISKIVKDFGKLISLNFTTIINNIKNLINGIKFFNPLVPVIEKVKAMIKELFKVVSENVSFDKFKDSISSLLGEFKSGTVNDFNKFTNTFKDFFASLKGIKIIDLNGIRESFQVFKDTLKEQDWESIWNSFNKVIQILVGFTAMYGFITIMQSLADSFNKLATPIKALGGVFDAFRSQIGNVGNALKQYIDSKRTSESIKYTALMIGAITLLVAAMYALIKIGDPVAVWHAVAAIGVMVGICVTASKLLKGPDAKAGLENLEKMILSLALAMIAVGIALNAIKDLDPNNSNAIIKAALALVIGLAGLAAAIVGISKFAGESTVGAKTILSLAGSMIIMAIAFKMLSGMDMDTITKVANEFIKFMLIFSAINVVLSRFKGGTNVGAQILAISAAMFIFATAIGKIASFGPKKTYSGIVGMIPIFIMFTVLAKIMSKASASISNIGEQILKIAGALTLIAIAMKILANIDTNGLVKAGLTVSILLVILTGIYIALEKLISKQMSGENAGKSAAAAALTIFSMSASLILMAAAMLIFKNLDTKGLIKGGVTICVLLLAMGTALLLANKAISGANPNSIKLISQICVAFGILAASVVALSLSNPKKVLTSAGSMLALVIAMGLVIKELSKVKATNIKGLEKVLIEMVALIAASGIVLGLLANFVENPESLIKVATSLGICMITLASSMILLNKFGGTSRVLKSIGKMILEMSAILILSSAALGLLANFTTNPESLIPIATALGIVMLALAGSMAIITNFGTASGKADWNSVFQTILMVVAMVGTVALALGVLSNQIQNPENLITIAGAMALVMLALAPLSVALGTALAACNAANLGGGGLGALGLLVSVIVISIAIAALVIYLASLVPDVAPIKHAGDVLEAVGDAIGRCIGAFVGGVFGEAIEGTLAGLGRGIAALSEGLVPFIDVINTVPDGFVGKCSAVMLGIAEIIGVEALATLEKGFEKFSLIFGVKSSLNEDLITFAQTMVQFSNELDGINVSRVNAAAKAASGLAELMNALPSEGGIISWFTGDSSHSLENFGTGLSGLALGLTSMSDNMKDFDPSCAEKASSAGKAMAELYNLLPKEGGLAQDIFGSTQSMSTFGENIKSYCEYIVTAMDTIAGAKNLNEDTWNKAKAAGDTFSELQNGLLSSTGDSLYSMLMGKQQDLKSFGEGINTFCMSLVDMGTLMSGGTTSYGFESPGFKQDALDKAILAGQTIDEFQKTLSGTSGLFDKLENGSEHMSLSELGEELIKFSDYLIEFSNRLAWTDFTEVSAVGILLGGIANVETITQPLLANVDMVVLVYKDHIKKRMEETATYLLQLYQKNFIAALNQYYAAKYNGQKTLEGLINGLTTPSYLARIAQAGTDVANAFKDAFKTELDIHSPSGVMKEAGGFTIAGLVKGIEDNLTSVRDAGIETGATMIGAIAESVAYAEDALSGDAISPVITPVLDLSLVQQQAQGINSMMPGTSMALAGGIQNGVAFSGNANSMNNSVKIDFTVNNAGKDLSEEDIDKYGKIIADRVNTALGQMI